MKTLESGKFYITRGGGFAFVAAVMSPGLYPAIGKINSNMQGSWHTAEWNLDGSYGSKNHESDYDIIL